MVFKPGGRPERRHERVRHHRLQAATPRLDLVSGDGREEIHGRGQALGITLDRRGPGDIEEEDRHLLALVD